MSMLVCITIALAVFMVAKATNNHVRLMGATGGVVTLLLALFEAHGH